jgi:hypothetical protein
VTSGDSAGGAPISSVSLAARTCSSCCCRRLGDGPCFRRYARPRRVDAAERALVNNPDGVCSLYRLGFEIDERAEERLRELKRSGQPPQAVLPGLDIIFKGLESQRLRCWVESHGKAKHEVEPIGRRLTGERPTTLDATVKRLVASLAGLPEKYPLPHYRGAK